MDVQYSGTLVWDLNEIARALKLDKPDVRDYFTDGRRVSFILERRLCKEIVKGTLAPTEGSGFDLIDSKGGKWEVRSITTGGIYFCPSYMVGSGRHFECDGFLQKLDEVKGYIISDIEGFPNIPFWVISSRQVKAWWESGKSGTNSRASRKTILRLLKEI